MLKTEAYLAIVLMLVLVIVIEMRKCRVRAWNPHRRRCVRLSLRERIEVRVLGGLIFGSLFHQFHSEIERCDHDVGSRWSFAGNIKRSAVMRAGSRKWESQGEVYSCV